MIGCSRGSWRACLITSLASPVSAGHLQVKLRRTYLILRICCIFCTLHPRRTSTSDYLDQHKTNAVLPSTHQPHVIHEDVYHRRKRAEREAGL